MKVDCPLGDVVDRVTILEIKSVRLADPGKVRNVRSELGALRAAWEAEGLPSMEGIAEYPALADVNTALWDVEDALRDRERRGDFGPEFVELARSVYRLNDRRAALKRAISLTHGSEFVEEKSY